jgi:PadR family transcriptional regulator PadR
MTLQVQVVLRALLDDPVRDRYGLDLCTVTGLASGTVYPILARLEQLGWVQSRWEQPEAHVSEHRPRRRYYTITSDGAVRARTAIAQAYRSRKQPVPGWLRRAGTAGSPS